jgi:hypothetical protein
MANDWAIQMATEALIGMQHDCNAMMKLTKEERDSLLHSVAASLREAYERGQANQRGQDKDLLATLRVVLKTFAWDKIGLSKMRMGIETAIEKAEAKQEHPDPSCPRCGGEFGEHSACSKQEGEVNE